MINLRRESRSGHGILLPDYNIGLDTRNRSVRFTVISHAHADHISYTKYTRILCTQATADLIKARGVKASIEILEFQKTYQFDNFDITLYPAGHILGSALIFIESELGNLLYTGDFKTPPSPVTEGFSLPEKQIDILIAEATFGLPIYKWKPVEFYENEIITFAEKELANDTIPVFLAYNLGKAQELLHILANVKIPVMIHPAGYTLTHIYKKYGFDMGNYQKLDHKKSKGHVLVIPSSYLTSREMTNIKSKSIAYVSGWASIESRNSRLSANRRIALSDHVDFYDLMDMIATLRPRITYITHSPNPEIVCHFIQKMGLNATPFDTIDISNP